MRETFLNSTFFDLVIRDNPGTDLKTRKQGLITFSAELVDRNRSQRYRKGKNLNIKNVKLEEASLARTQKSTYCLRCLATRENLSSKFSASYT